MNDRKLVTTIAHIRRGIQNDEAQFFWTLGRWDINAGFFWGFGLGFTLLRGEWEVTLGPFSIGAIASGGRR